MVELKRSDMRQIDDAFGMGSGYVLNFSDCTMAEWFEDELKVDIDHERFKALGTSKANRVRCFVKTEGPTTVAHMLRLLWAYRETIDWKPYEATPEQIEKTKSRLFDLIERIEGTAPTPTTDAVVVFAQDETLEELVLAIRRDAEANKPQAGLDRLHTYCMKKFAHLLGPNVKVARDEPLHSRVGKYVKKIEAERQLRPITRQIMKNCIGIFQSYNDVRNNDSFAHDNPVLDEREARFIFDVVVSMLRFIRTIEADKFEPVGG